MGDPNFCQIHHCGIEYDFKTNSYYCPKCVEEDRREKETLNIKIEDDIEIDDSVRQ